jgi:predicted dienelactone hydrolase
MVRLSRSIALLLVVSGCSHPSSLPPSMEAHVCPAVFDQPALKSPPARTQRLPSYAVGVTSDEYVDMTRKTPANGAVAEQPSRDLPAEIWYPAQSDASAPETSEAPLDLRGAPYPLVVFVHGSDSLHRQSVFLMQGLAARGYVVVAADFPLTYVLTPGGASDQHVDMQVCDVAFIANRLFARSNDPKDQLYGALDPAAGYAVAGHSTGGSVALATAFGSQDHDPRVRAAVALAPCACFFPEHFFRSRPTPLLVIAGTDDGFVPPSDNGERAYQLSTEPKRLAVLKGGTHLNFSDLNRADGAQNATHNDSAISEAFLAEGPGGACDPAPPIGTDPLMAFQTQHQLTVSIATAFLDAQMYGDPAALNAIDQTPPMLVSWQQ